MFAVLTSLFFASARLSSSSSVADAELNSACLPLTALSRARLAFVWDLPERPPVQRERGMGEHLSTLSGGTYPTR